MEDFRELEIWNKSHQLTLAIYQVTGDFPEQELQGLTGQLRRSSAAIPASIAEGCGRNGSADMARFLQIAAGSASETGYHLLLARDLGLLSGAEYDRLMDMLGDIECLLAASVQKLKARRLPL